MLLVIPSTCSAVVVPSEHVYTLEPGGDKVVDALVSKMFGIVTTGS